MSPLLRGQPAGWQQPGDIRPPDGLQRLPGPEGGDQPGAGPGGEGLLLTKGGHEEDPFGAAAQTETECDKIVTL